MSITKETWKPYSYSLKKVEVTQQNKKTSTNICYVPYLARGIKTITFSSRGSVSLNIATLHFSILVHALFLNDFLFIFFVQIFFWTSINLINNEKVIETTNDLLFFSSYINHHIYREAWHVSIELIYHAGVVTAFSMVKFKCLYCYCYFASIFVLHYLSQWWHRLLIFIQNVVHQGRRDLITYITSYHAIGRK